MDVRPDDLTDTRVIQLLESHLAEMAQHSPPESIHALDLDGLKQPAVTFWTIWEQDDLLGCGALKQHDPSMAEIKSMRTAPQHRRRGIAAIMLQYLLDECITRGYDRVSLETGSQPAFEPARQLYERFGFDYCGPFADYVADPNSVFMTKLLNAQQGNRQ